MFKRKCPSCAKKIERGFNFCPYCGESFKVRRDEEDFGMLGRDDSENVKVEQKLPFGIDKIMNSLIKQMEKQMENVDFNGVGKGIKINVVRGVPQIKREVKKMPEKKKIVQNVSREEMEKRMKAKKVEAESKVKRLSDKIIYEIEAPGISNKKDVVVTELATGLEIRAYVGDKCYVKFIPLKVEISEYYVKNEKVFVEMKD